MALKHTESLALSSPGDSDQSIMPADLYDRVVRRVGGFHPSFFKRLKTTFVGAEHPPYTLDGGPPDAKLVRRVGGFHPPNGSAQGLTPTILVGAEHPPYFRLISLCAELK